MKKKLLCASLIIAASSLVFANDNPNFTKLEDTVITTENFETTVRDTPANISIITGEQIEKSGAKDLVQALQNVPGISVKRYAGTIKFDIRGVNSMYSDRNTLITLDGVPVSPDQVANLPIENISKIEVIPGGGAVLYGDKAIGGVVNIISKSALDKKFYGNVYLETGNYHYSKKGFDFGTKITDRLLTEVGFTKSNPSVWRHGEKFDKNDARFRAKYLLDKGDVEFKYTHSEDKDKRGVAVPRYVTNKDRRDPGFLSGGKHKSNDYYLKFRKELDKDLEFLAYGNFYERKNWSYDDETNKYNRDDTDEKLYGKFQLKKTYMDSNYFIVGFDYLKDKIKPKEKFAGIKGISGTWDKEKKEYKEYKYMEFGDSVKRNYGIFAMNKINYNKFQFTQGIRYDKADYDFYWKNGSLNNKEKIGTKGKNKYGDYSLELSANYLYSDTGSTYLTFTRAFRTPTISEMRYTKNSEKLKPQTQDTIELGVKDFVANTYVSMGTFYKWTHDEIYSAIPPEVRGMVNYNIGNTRRVGFEAFAEHYIGDLTLNGSVTYLHHKVVDGKYKNSRIPSVPNWKLTAGANYNITPNFNVGGDWLYYSNSYDLDDLENKRGETVKGYYIFNLSACYKFENGIELTARIENIFDKKYDEYVGYWMETNAQEKVKKRQYYPAIGRNYTLGIKYNF